MSQAVSPPAQPPEVWHPPKPRPVLTILCGVALLIAIGAILQLWGLGPFAGAEQKTDNAMIRGRMTVVASQVSGYVVKVLVRDYQAFEAGQICGFVVSLRSSR